ncbi:MAG: ABC transporter permease subunit [Hamadaea sp.]|uniref:ABC transporter permease subunit n=1 Tax=Hamadaea sp. TaxID=2024425 RepID=UPI00180BA5A3|nr:ABC transporter permease subunit [Hamadaea sp.]NUR71970.1 ABC transporter permease subunit [Hamadaea sp.]NUT18592.1 ABC transporter permease subunit [Hamadaea sp.]
MSGFGGLLRAEWVKLRSVNRWLLTLFGAAVLTIGISLLGANGSSTDVNEKPNFVIGPAGTAVADAFAFVHQPVTGDVTLTVKVGSLVPQDEPDERDSRDGKMTKLKDPSPWKGAFAGLMIKDGTQSGASYAAVSVSSENGVRLQSDFHTDIAGKSSTAPQWLRLTRTGNVVTAYQSADGGSWQKIGEVTPAHLPATAEIGFYVSSSPTLYVSRGAGGSSVAARTTLATGTFDNVTMTGATAAAWQTEAVKQPQDDEILQKKGMPEVTAFSESGGTYTVTGIGRIGPEDVGDDPVESSLLGVIAGIMALIAVGVLFATSEYRRGMIRTTFAAEPRRGRVLAAKAVVLGGVAFVLSLVGVVAGYLIARPALRKNGFAPPAFPDESITDPVVIRVLVLSAAFMALLTVFAMAVGLLLRHSAGAITLTIVLVILPIIVGSILPGTVLPKLLMYATLAGGMATQRAKPPSQTLAEPWSLIGPWAGLSVVAAYTAVALGLAWWSLRRRDV